MNLLFISKRQYTGKDLIDDQYGRLFEIPYNLYKQGHNVEAVCLSYRKRSQGIVFSQKQSESTIEWQSVNIGMIIIYGVYSYIKLIIKAIKRNKPDIVIASSDIYQVILGSWLANRYSVPFIVDLYDNYESFGLSNLPFVKKIFKYSVRNADGIACVSNTLHQYILDTYRPVGHVETIENGIVNWNCDAYKHTKLRNQLGIPDRSFVVGTAGALNVNRGIDDLLMAFMMLRKNRSDIYLLLAGQKSPGVVFPNDANLRYLGNIPHNKVPELLKSLDVGVICNIDSDFGRYCFPQKAYEMLACKVAIIASNVGSMKEMLKEYPECLYPPGDYEQLSLKIESQLKEPKVIDIEPVAWSSQANKMNSLIEKVM